MATVEAGLHAGKIPYIRGGSGPGRAVVFFGGNALLFKRPDMSRPRGTGTASGNGSGADIRNLPRPAGLF